MTQTKSLKKESLFPSVLTDFFDNDRFFSNTWLERQLDRSLPAVNIKENNDGYDIEFAAPGFRKNDFKVEVEENVLTVTAEKEEEKKEDNERFTRKEFSYNSFCRSFTLPQGVNTDKIDAKYDDGILQLQIPKKDEAKKLPKKEIAVA